MPGALLAAMSLSCYSLGTTWRRLGPGETARPGMIVVTGSIYFEPPLALSGPDEGILVYFSEGLEGQFDSSQHPPLASGTTAWLPVQGTFAVELPSTVRYLRGYVHAHCGHGHCVHGHGHGTRVELPIRLDLRPGDRAVEVGQIVVVRTSPRKIIVRPPPRGNHQVTVRLAEPGS